MLNRVFQILDSIALNNSSTIDEISNITKIPRSSVHRILQSLIKENIVSLIPKKGYGLTPRLITLGLKGMGERNIMEIAIPVMRKLHQETRETISLNIASGFKRLCLWRIEGDYPVCRLVKIGDTDVLVRNSAGKIIASSFTDDELEKLSNYYVNEGIIKAEEKASFLKEIKKVRKQGYAISVAERAYNSASIGVPIFDFTGHIQASLSISGILERMTKKTMDHYLQLLLKNAEQINLDMYSGK